MSPLSVLVLFLLSGGQPAARFAGEFSSCFQRAPLIAILLTLQIVPYFMTGFESVPKAAEEASWIQSARIFAAIFLAVIVGAGFYVLVTAAVAYVAPWQRLLGKPFATAIAFEQGTGAPWLVRIVMASAMLALFEVFQRKFRRLQPIALRLWPPWHDSCSFRQSS